MLVNSFRLLQHCETAIFSLVIYMMKVEKLEQGEVSKEPVEFRWALEEKQDWWKGDILDG